MNDVVAAWRRLKSLTNARKTQQLYHHWGASRPRQLNVKMTSLRHWTCSEVRLLPSVDPSNPGKSPNHPKNSGNQQFCIRLKIHVLCFLKNLFVSSSVWIRFVRSRLLVSHHEHDYSVWQFRNLGDFGFLTCVLAIRSLREIVCGMSLFLAFLTWDLTVVAPKWAVKLRKRAAIPDCVAPEDIIVVHYK